MKLIVFGATGQTGLAVLRLSAQDKGDMCHLKIECILQTERLITAYCFFYNAAC